MVQWMTPMQLQPTEKTINTVLLLAEGGGISVLDKKEDAAPTMSKIIKLHDDSFYKAFLLDKLTKGEGVIYN